MKTILVPTDFSEKAKNALDFALEFNEKIKGRVVIMHVLDFPSSSFSTIGEMSLENAELLYQGEFIKGVRKNLMILKIL